MTTITEFLNARLNEDEQAARYAFAAHNDAQPDWYEIRSGAVNLGDHEDELLTFDAGISRHIVRHDPARVLREVAAKRAVLSAHANLADNPHRHTNPRVHAQWVTMIQVVQHMAAVYADHPDYQQEWAP